jgi:hypothetical protein
MKLKKYTKNFLWIISFSIALFYHNYKHKVVEIGNGDYGAYLNIAKTPFDPLVTDEPFNMRQLTPMMARLVVESGLYYPTIVLHTNKVEEQRYFFAFMLVNYIGLILMLMLLMEMYDYYFPELRYFERIASIGLITGSMGFLFSGLSMMTEGWTYFFNLLLFYLFLRKKYLIYLLIGILSIFQRETSLIFAVGLFGMLFLVEYYCNKDWSALKSLWLWIGISIVILAIYLILKKLFFSNPLGGNQEQISLNAMVSRLLEFRFTGEWINQIIFTQWIFIGLLFLNFAIIRRRTLFTLLQIAYSLSVLFLIIIGIITGIGPNIGRILSSTTPIWVFLFFPPTVKYFNTFHSLNNRE